MLYGVAYGLSFPRILRLIVSMVLVDFVLVGIVVSTLAWYAACRRAAPRWLSLGPAADATLHGQPRVRPAGCARLFCNRFLRVQTVHSVEQKVEWAYAFDVHCNGFVPILLLLYLLQFFFLPILTKPTFLATLLGNTLYFVALSYYQYIIFLGYSGTHVGGGRAGPACGFAHALVAPALGLVGRAQHCRSCSTPRRSCCRAASTLCSTSCRCSLSTLVASSSSTISWDSAARGGPAGPSCECVACVQLVINGTNNAKSATSPPDARAAPPRRRTTRRRMRQPRGVPGPRLG